MPPALRDSLTGQRRGRARGRTAWAAVRTAVLTFVHALAAERQLRRVTRELESLDDHRLRDLGLTRGSIERAVRFGRPSDGDGQDRSAGSDHAAAA